MKFSSRMLYLLVLLLACLMLTCQKTQEAEKNPKLSLKDVWVSNITDADQDGFVSHYRLNFDLDVSDGSMNVFVWLGFQFYDEADTATSYYPYFESANFSVQGTGDGDAKYIDIGLPNIELPQAAYDFLFIVFDASEEDKRLAEVSEDNDDDLLNIPIESSDTDIGVTIYDAAFDDFIDQDGDGFASQATLWVDVDENIGNGAFVRLALYEKTSGSGSYNFLGLTEPFTVTGDAEEDVIGIDLDGFSHGSYDFMLELIFNNSVFLEDKLEAATWPALAGIDLELSSEDQAQFVITFNNFVFTDIEVSVSGYGTKTAPVGGSALFTLPGNPGTFSYSAETAGYTTGGTQIGHLVVWSDTKNVSGMTSATYNLNVASTLFFLRMQNTGTVSLTPLVVNYGTVSQRTENISIPNTGVLYRIGYFQAFTNTQIRAYWNGTTDYTWWEQGTHFTFPFTTNQVLSLLNTFKTKSTVQNSVEAPARFDLPAGLPEPAGIEISSNQNEDRVGEIELGYAAETD